MDLVTNRANKNVEDHLYGRSVKRRRERARAQGLEGDDESNGWAPTTKEPKDELQAQSMKQVPIHASARRGRAEGGAEAEEA